jgi:hypothetical protein
MHKSILSVVTILFGAAAAPLAAAEPITAVMTIRGTGDDTPQLFSLPGLQTEAQCLGLAWTASIRKNDTWTHKEVTVSCLQGDRIIAAQICANGTCSKMEPPQ